MNRGREPFLAWPGFALVGYALFLGALQSLWWMLAYGGADWVAGLHSFRVRIHLDAELSIPFVPAFVLVYLSISPLFLMSPFVLRSRRQLQALALALAVVTGVAAGSFLVMPAAPAYPPQDAGGWTWLVQFARRVALRHNMVPSLHVTMSCVTLAAYAQHCGRLGKWLLAGWASLIALSTLLTHQHHLVDVAGGFLLAWAGYRLVYLRWLNRLT